MKNAYTIYEARIQKRQGLEDEREVKTLKDQQHQKLDKVRVRYFLILFIVFCIGLFVLYKVNIPSYFQSENKSEKETSGLETSEKSLPNNSTFKDLLSQSPLTEGSIEGKIKLGSEEPVSTSVLMYVPDGHISKIEENGKITLFISAHDKSYIMQGNTLKDMKLLTDENKQPKPILQPEYDYEIDYSGFGQVIENPYTRDLIGIYHTEVRINPDASDSQQTSIALARSKDRGYTWVKMGQIIKGQNTASVGTRVSGAGQPSGIVVGDYIYLYFLDWNAQMVDAIHLARAPLKENGMPGTWEKYFEGSFVEPGLGGKSTPVITPPYISEKQVVFTANPSISYNNYLGKYLAIFETNIGFFSSISEDGINWHSPELIFEFPKDMIIPKNIGDIWYSYPSLISEKTSTDMISGKTGYLYYSRGVFGQDHKLVRRSFVIE